MPYTLPTPFFPYWLSHRGHRRSMPSSYLRHPVSTVDLRPLQTMPMVVSSLYAQRSNTVLLLRFSRRALTESRRLLEDARTRTTPPPYVRQLQRLLALQQVRRLCQARLRVIS